MTVTDSWDPSQPDEYKDDDILLPYGVFDVGNNPSIHPNFFKGVLNDSLGRLYNNDAPITPTQLSSINMLAAILGPGCCFIVTLRTFWVLISFTTSMLVFWGSHMAMHKSIPIKRIVHNVSRIPVITMMPVTELGRIFFGVDNACKSRTSTWL